MHLAQQADVQKRQMAELSTHLDEMARMMLSIHEVLNLAAMEAEGSINQRDNALGSVEALHPMFEVSINVARMFKRKPQVGNSQKIPVSQDMVGKSLSLGNS